MQNPKLFWSQNQRKKRTKKKKNLQIFFPNKKSKYLLFQMFDKKSFTQEKNSDIYQENILSVCWCTFF